MARAFILALIMVAGAAGSANAGERDLLLAAGGRGMTWLYDGATPGGGPGAALSVLPFQYFRADVDFTYAFVSNQDDGPLVGLLLSGQYPSIGASPHAVFAGVGYGHWFQNDPISFLRAAIGYAFNWQALFFRVAWEPHLGFYEALTTHASGPHIALLTTTLFSFTASLSLGIDLL